MEYKIDNGDSVKHIPTGETWKTEEMRRNDMQDIITKTIVDEMANESFAINLSDKIKSAIHKAANEKIKHLIESRNLCDKDSSDWQFWHGAQIQIGLFVSELL